MTEKMYFKVTDANMRSVYSEYQGKYAVQYRLGEFVRPIAGRLFVYDLSDVRDYGFREYTSRSVNKRRLWICECINPIRSEYKICCFDEVEKMYEQPDSIIYLEDFITTQADAVKLVEEISLEYLDKLRIL